MNKYYFVLYVLLFFLNTITAQQSVVALGGDYKTEAGTLSFTIGQVNYEYIENIDLESVVEGVQQTYKIVEEKEPDSSPLYRISLYPNPTSDIVYLEIENIQIRDLYYLVTDIRGRVLYNEPITKRVSEISFGGFEDATYLISLKKNGISLGNYRLIKK